MVKFLKERPLFIAAALFAAPFLVRLMFHWAFFPDFEGIFDSYRRLLISESIASAGIGGWLGNEAWRLLWLWLPLPFYFNVLTAEITELHRILLPILYIAASSSSALILYYCCKRIWNAKTGIIAWALVAFSPFHIAYSSMLLSETLMILLLVCALYCALRSTERLTTNIVASGFFLGAAMLTRFEAWILFPFFAVWVILRFRSRRVIAGIAVASAFAGPALYLLKTYAVYGEFFAFRPMLIEYQKAISDTSISGWIESAPEAATGFFLLFFSGLHILPSAAPALARYIKDRKRLSEREKLAVALPVVLLLFLCFSFLTHNAAGYARYGLAPMFFLAPPASKEWGGRRLLPTVVGYAVALIGIMLSLAWGESDSELRIATQLTRESVSSGKIYCESPIAQVESRLPLERFIATIQLNESTVGAYFDSLGVTRIVILEIENSIAPLVSRLRESGKLSQVVSPTSGNRSESSFLKRTLRSVIRRMNAVFTGAFTERKVYLYDYRPDTQ